MKKTIRTLVESGDVELATQIRNFLNEYPNQKDEMKVLAFKILDLAKGSAYMDFFLDIMGKVHTSSSTLTSYKNMIRHGKGADVLGTKPVLTVYQLVVPLICNANVEGLFRDIIQDCVNSGNLTEDIAKALGIFAESSTTVLADGTPDLSLKSMSGGHPMLHTILTGYDAYEIWKDSGTGFVFQNVSTTSDYTDQSPLPALGVEAVWKYKIIYRSKNLQIGHWSTTLSVAVKGNV